MFQSNKDIVVGLDLSLTSTGMSAVRIKDGKFQILDWANPKTDSKEDWFTRVNRIQTEVVRFIWKHKPSKIFVEGYSFGSRNGRELAGEVNGIILFQLMTNGYPQEDIHKIISPQGRAKFATGNGKGTKSQVVKYVNETFGLSLKVSKENDIADAIVLAFIGYSILHYNQIEPTLNKPQKEVLQKIFEKHGGLNNE
jgi:Holliday junction resolvasome RuvABC endonuclease subunit